MRAYAFSLATLLALAATAAPAQTPMRGGPGGPGRRMERLFKDITLTPAQQAKVDSIQAHYRTERPSFTPGTPPDSATREKIRALFQRERDDLRAVLTPDQQKAFDRNVEDMRQRRPGGGA
jgi:Spy/CpxP family protein refolding chaperone